MAVPLDMAVVRQPVKERPDVFEVVDARSNPRSVELVRRSVQKIRPLRPRERSRNDDSALPRAEAAASSVTRRTRSS